MDGFTEIRPLGLVSTLATNPQPAEVSVTELGLAASTCLGVAICAVALCGTDLIDLIVDLVVLEGGAQGRRDGARDAEALVAVVEDVQEGERGVFVDCGRGGGVNEVPGGADVRVGDVEGFVERL